MQELMQDKDELQKKVCEQLKQLSQLRAQVCDLTLSTAGQPAVDVERPTSVEELRIKVDELTSALDVRDKEVQSACWADDSAILLLVMGSQSEFRDKIKLLVTKRVMYQVVWLFCES